VSDAENGVRRREQPKFQKRAFTARRIPNWNKGSSSSNIFVGHVPKRRGRPQQGAPQGPGSIQILEARRNKENARRYGRKKILGGRGK